MATMVTVLSYLLVAFSLVNCAPSTETSKFSDPVTTVTSGKGEDDRVTTVATSSSSSPKTLQFGNPDEPGIYRVPKILPGDEVCRSMEIEADKSFKKLLMIGENLVIPRNDSELITYCKQGKGAMKLASRYGKCLKPFPRQVLSIVIRGGKRSLKEYCDASKGRQEILKHLECITPSTAQIFYGAIEHGFRQIDYIAGHIPDEELLPTLCCTFHLIYNQTINLVRSHCTSSADSTVKFLRAVIDNIAKDVLDLGCGKWPNLPSCDAQIGSTMKQLRSIGPAEAIHLKNRFLIAPIVQIAARLVA